LGAGTASYLVVELSRQALLEEFLAAVSDDRVAQFAAISVDDPSLTPKVIKFSVRVREIYAQKPLIIEVVDAKDSRTSFQITFHDQEAVCFEIIT
jgi:hypothetical protein